MPVVMPSFSNNSVVSMLMYYTAYITILCKIFQNTSVITTIKITPSITVKPTVSLVQKVQHRTLCKIVLLSFSTYCQESLYNAASTSTPVSKNCHMCTYTHDQSGIYIITDGVQQSRQRGDVCDPYGIHPAVRPCSSLWGVVALVVKTHTCIIMCIYIY